MERENPQWSCGQRTKSHSPTEEHWNPFCRFRVDEWAEDGLVGWRTAACFWTCAWRWPGPSRKAGRSEALTFVSVSSSAKLGAHAPRLDVVAALGWDWGKIIPIITKGRNLFQIHAILLSSYAVSQVFPLIYRGRIIAMKKCENLSDDGRRNPELRVGFQVWGSWKCGCCLLNPIYLRICFAWFETHFS